MRQYNPAHGPKVDLDDPKTYSHLPDDVEKLDDLIFIEIGKALVYMDYFPDRKKFFPKRKQKSDWQRFCDVFPEKKYKNNHTLIDLNNGGYDQRQRIQKLITNFAENRRKKFEDVMWLKEQLYLLEDETENMC